MNVATALELADKTNEKNLQEALKAASAQKSIKEIL